MGRAITQTGIKELKKLFSGKVRDIYEFTEGQWLIVTTDRISAFDVVFNEGVPEKGMVLNTISNKWFNRMKFIKNHIISEEPAASLEFLNGYEGIPERSVLVKKVNRLPIECVVRGFLFGSVYNEYKTTGSAGGIKLKSGLQLAEKLPEPIFTPSTKESEGHDRNINYSEMCDIVDKKTADKIIEFSVRIYTEALSVMGKEGIILADTKFEFGLDQHSELILVDEVLTPDSSRYWDMAAYKTGESPQSYDKQFVRDYLDSIGWDRTPPAPVLPSEIIEKTRGKYLNLLDVIRKIV
ncbi:MAG: phosphoribosylaminoimidazolesuccinocarboxamide synthase [Brevinematales bacterium]|jgi:phosphoribosylaminoimidazole-succinocarboxamide synthase